MRKTISNSFPSRVLIAVALGVALGACGGPRGDQQRTVHSYEYASCDSIPTTDATERAALDAFKTKIELSNFVRHKDTLTAASHEESLEASGLREYEGPLYFYLHPGKVEPRQASQGVTWIGMAYLHANKVRTRKNGGEWGEWQRVRTRNFGSANRTVDGLGRWKCLVGSEIAWAEVRLQNGEWQVEPQAISVYEGAELARLLSVPTSAQIAGTEAVEPMHIEAKGASSDSGSAFARQ
jgi:hypothetical protein